MPLKISLTKKLIIPPKPRLITTSNPLTNHDNNVVVIFNYEELSYDLVKLIESCSLLGGIEILNQFFI